MIHAYADDALGHDDAVGLAARLASGEVSSRELTEAAIARAEAVADRLGALACTDYDRALQAAVERDAAGPPEIGVAGRLAGVPTYLKDNVAVAGLPIQNGCDAYVGRPARADGALARTFRSLGLIFLGKTQLSEFGFNASAEHARLGPVRNPWDPAFTAGASSSGSAALVASGVVPLAHANDGGGSIRIPAAVCGLVGLKPTRGRLPEDQLYRQMPVRIVADGVLTRTVRDTAAFFAAAERIVRHPTLPPVGDVRGPGRRRLRIALMVDSPRRTPTAGVAAAVRDAGRALAEFGHSVEEIDPPMLGSFTDDFLIFWSSLAQVILTTGRVQHGPTWDRSACDPVTLGLARHSRRTTHRLPGAIRRLRASPGEAARMFAAYDAVLSPTLAHETPRLGHLDPAQGCDEVMERLLDWVAYTPYANASGEPSLAVPWTRDENGLPIGVMLGAGRGQEALLLRLGYELEQARTD